MKDLVKTLSLGAAKASEGPERDLENWEQRLKERGKVSVALVERSQVAPKARTAGLMKK